MLALLAGRSARAEPLAIEVKPATAAWQQKVPVEVTLKVSNPSKAPVTFQVMGCSWEDHWKSSDRELTWMPWGCDKNAPSRVELAPGQAREWKLPMFATENAKPGPHRLVMTFTPRDGKPSTSGPVTITVRR